MSKLLASNVSRRTFLAASGAAGAVTLATPAVLRAQSKRIVYATWGGTWEQAMREAWFDPFTKKTGIEVVTAPGNTYGKLKAMVEAGTPEWDVIEAQPDLAFLSERENLLDPLDFKMINTDEVMKGDGVVTPVSVPQVVYSGVLFHNKNTFTKENHPRSWADIWDVERFPGKRMLPTFEVSTGAFDGAMLADGVTREELPKVPVDIDRVLKAFDRIRDHILWYNTNAQGEQYMMDGQAVMGTAGDGRIYSALKNGAPIDFDYNDSLLKYSIMAIPRGSANKDAAMEFLNYTLTLEAQAAIGMAYNYGPVCPRAFDLIPAERAKTLSGGPQQQGLFALHNERWWGENQQLAQSKFNAWRIQ